MYEQSNSRRAVQDVSKKSFSQQVATELTFTEHPCVLGMHLGVAVLICIALCIAIDPIVHRIVPVAASFGPLTGIPMALGTLKYRQLRMNAAGVAIISRQFGSRKSVSVARFCTIDDVQSIRLRKSRIGIVVEVYCGNTRSLRFSSFGNRTRFSSDLESMFPARVR